MSLPSWPLDVDTAIVSRCFLPAFILSHAPTLSRACSKGDNPTIQYLNPEQIVCLPAQAYYARVWTLSRGFRTIPYGETLG